jgi:putative flippase GtrA
MTVEGDIVATTERETAPAVSFLGSKGIHEFIRYAVASAAALALDVGSLWLFVEMFHVPYLVSGAVAFLVGLTVIYILSVYWVFDARVLSSRRAEFMLFALIGVIGLLLNEFMLWLFTERFGLFYMFSKLASVIVVFSWNFGARKWFLFRTR